MEAARRFFRGRDVVIEPRKLWVSGLAGRKGKIAGVAPGRALAFADDPAWGDVLRVLWQRDAPAPPEVLDGLVQVLVRWSANWQRPVAVVPMPSQRFPLLVGSLAEQVARIGRLPLVDALGVSGPPAPAEAASAVRARDLLARTSVGDGVSFDGPVLLVDDTVRTRWTFGCVGAVGRRRREPGDAARRPPALLSATPGVEERFFGRGRPARPRREACYILRNRGWPELR